MIRIMLACAGGMSTSLLMNKMKEEADNRGLEVSVEAIGEKTLEQHLGEFDVLLLGPQVRYVIPNVIIIQGIYDVLNIVLLHFLEIDCIAISIFGVFDNGYVYSPFIEGDKWYKL